VLYLYLNQPKQNSNNCELKDKRIQIIIIIIIIIIVTTIINHSNGNIKWNIEERAPVGLPYNVSCSGIDWRQSAESHVLFLLGALSWRRQDATRDSVSTLRTGSLGLQGTRVCFYFLSVAQSATRFYKPRCPVLQLQSLPVETIADQTASDRHEYFPSCRIEVLTPAANFEAKLTVSALIGSAYIGTPKSSSICLLL
jgi:hypothetical protein